MLKNPLKYAVVWMIAGILIWGIVNLCFYMNSGRYTVDVQPERNLLSRDDPSVEFKTDPQVSHDYLDIYVATGSALPVKAYLYTSVNKDGTDVLPEERRISITIRNGLNEINVLATPKMKLELDLSEVSDGSDKIIEEPTLEIKRIRLLKSRNPLFVLPVSFLCFIALWSILYMLLKGLKVSAGDTEGSYEVLFAGITTVIMTVILTMTKIRHSYPFLFILLFLMVFILFLRNNDKAGRIWESHMFLRLSSWKAVSVFLMLYLVMLIWTGNTLVTEPTSDAGEIYYSASEYINDGEVNREVTGEESVYWATHVSNNDYFAVHPQNRPMLAYFTGYLKLLTYFGLKCPSYGTVLALTCINILHIFAAVIFVILAADRLFGRRGRFICCILILFFIPYYTNTVVFYTDTLSMPYLALALLLYVMPERKSGQRYVRHLFTGMAVSAGALIKGSVTVILIAMCLDLFFRGGVRLQDRRKIADAGCLLAGFALVSFIYGNIFFNVNHLDLSRKDELELPKIHYLMMGINPVGKGAYMQEDYDYTTSFSKKEEKTRACLKKISERLADFDTCGDYVNFLFQKAANTWGDGRFMELYTLDHTYRESFLKQIILVDRSGYGLYNSYTTVYVMVLYYAVLIGAVASLKKRSAGIGIEGDPYVFLLTALCGAAALLMLWESKSRYLLNFTPLIFLCACRGFIKEKDPKEKEIL